MNNIPFPPIPPIPQTSSIRLLEAIGFEYAVHIPSDFLNEDFNKTSTPPYCEIEVYMGYEIQVAPTFAVIHSASGHCWIPLFEETENLERVKLLICKGIQQDLEELLSRTGGS